MKRKFKVLYTHQKTKKHKVWQDGLLYLTADEKRGYLKDEKDKDLSSIYLCKKQMETGSEFESDRYLIVVEEEILSDDTCKNVFEISQANHVNKENLSKKLIYPQSLKSKFTVPRRKIEDAKPDSEENVSATNEMTFQKPSCSMKSIWSSVADTGDDYQSNMSGHNFSGDAPSWFPNKENSAVRSASQLLQILDQNKESSTGNSSPAKQFSPQPCADVDVELPLFFDDEILSFDKPSINPGQKAESATPRCVPKELDCAVIKRSEIWLCTGQVCKDQLQPYEEAEPAVADCLDRMLTYVSACVVEESSDLTPPSGNDASAAASGASTNQGSSTPPPHKFPNDVEETFSHRSQTKRGSDCDQICDSLLAADSCHACGSVPCSCSASQHHTHVKSSPCLLSPSIRITKGVAVSEETVCEIKFDKNTEDNSVIAADVLVDTTTEGHDLCESESAVVCCCENIFPCRTALKLKSEKTRSRSCSPSEVAMSCFNDPSKNNFYCDLFDLDSFQMDQPISFNKMKSNSFGFKPTRTPSVKLTNTSFNDAVSDDFIPQFDLGFHRFELSSASTSTLLRNDDSDCLKPPEPQPPSHSAASVLSGAHVDGDERRHDDATESHSIVTDFSPTYSPLLNSVTASLSTFISTPPSKDQPRSLQLLPLDCGTKPDQQVPDLFEDFSHVTDVESLLLAESCLKSEKSLKFTSFEHDLSPLENLLCSFDDDDFVASHKGPAPIVDRPPTQLDLVDLGTPRDCPMSEGCSNVKTKFIINENSSNSRSHYDVVCPNHRVSGDQAIDETPSDSASLDERSPFTNTMSNFDRAREFYASTQQTEARKERGSNPTLNIGSNLVPSETGDIKKRRKSAINDLESIVKLGGVTSKRVVKHQHPPLRARHSETPLTQSSLYTLKPPMFSAPDSTPPLFFRERNLIPDRFRMNSKATAPCPMRPYLMSDGPRLRSSHLIAAFDEAALSPFDREDLGGNLSCDGGNLGGDFAFHEVPRSRDMTSPKFSFLNNFETSSFSEFLLNDLSHSPMCDSDPSYHPPCEPSSGLNPSSKWTQFENEDQYVPASKRLRRRWMEEMVKRETPGRITRNESSILKTPNLASHRGDTLWSQF